ncbi:MAG: 3-oxoacyl-ACP synthase [Thermodesulfobacteriota bacterium]|nr:3-oxoacyl-ACP synthase [Thermodesulfobacteriota bacterium]
MNERDVFIAGAGSFSPGDPIPFDSIEDVLGKITEAPKRLLKRINRIQSFMKGMLGIEYSHFALDPETREPTETNVSMAVKSSKKALEAAEMDPSEIDLIIYAGILYDYICPPSSVLVQDELNIPHCAELSIHSNCTSTYKAIQVASDLIANGRYNNALIISSQMSSTFLRAEYYNQKEITEDQAILRWFLSDGAGALVLTAKKPKKMTVKVVDTYLESVGVGIEPSMKMLIGSNYWNIQKIFENGWHHLTQDLKTVAQLSPELFIQGFKRMVEKTQQDISTVKCLFMNIPSKHLFDIGTGILRNEYHFDKLIYSKLSTRGYPGPPAIIIALDDYLGEADLDPGDRLVSFVTESSKWMHAGFILEIC